MHRILTLAALLLTLTASQCTPLQTTVQNKTGHDIYLTIHFETGVPDGHGTLKRGGIINLIQRASDIGAITYSYDQITCRLGPSDIKNAIDGQANGLDVLALRGC